MPRMTLTAILMGAALLGSTGQGLSQNARVKADAQELIDCVSTKAGPESDLPPNGPLRDQILKEMEGGPNACVGTIAAKCEKSSDDWQACNTRESLAWLQTVLVIDEPNRTEAMRRAWRNAANRIRPQASFLCEGSAATSAWGNRTFQREGRVTMSIGTRCVRDAIAQQAIIMLVNTRGN